jgi:hypothetical protein
MQKDAAPRLMRTLREQWLMEPFYCSATGKKLPGKHGQQDLIAAPVGLLADT